MCQIGDYQRQVWSVVLALSEEFAKDERAASSRVEHFEKVDRAASG